MKKIRTMKKISVAVSLTLALLVSSCGEYFAPEIPDEYDPDQLPDVVRILTEGSYDMFVGDKVQISPNALTINNGKTFAQQSANDKEYLLNTMLWSATHGDTIVMARAADLCITAMARGTDKVTFYNAGNAIGSCLFFVHDGTEPPTAIHLDRATIVLMEGEKWKPTITLEPSYCRNDDIDWESGNNDVVNVSNDGTISAVRAGTTTVYATATGNPEANTSITVTVLPNWWYQRLGNYRYETIIYATLEIDGDEATLDSDIIVAAILNNENHGTGKPNTWFQRPYMVFRVGNNALSDEENTYIFGFTGYDRNEHVIIDFDETFDFDGRVYGTLSAPIVLRGARRY